MNKEKRIWIALFLAITLMLIFSGCSGLPKTAKLNISIEPNPVPYFSEDGRWYFAMSISESNGVGISIASLTFSYYDQEDQLIGTQVLGVSEFLEWFEANYIPAFSMIQCGSISNSMAVKYAIITVEGVDDKDNPIEATERVDYLPQ